ncbi:hypothetical protein [Mycolicibacterium septicum]|uniref:hypothetical protein n=1 Tax=Mycolicibacterium septicum TaxID=98668 RepID=UPI001AF2BD3C|nr:hypothetical protein [Mycolicibacterium septicum]QRY53707.1 hypothetical protein JVX95_10475 [Mycolicibacterium septicum]
MGDTTEPWWATDPELKEFFRRSQEQLEREIAAHEPVVPDEPAEIVSDLSVGTRVHALGLARDDLARAQVRYEQAVLAGRQAGLSWAQIGRVLGVSKQRLHSRFRRYTA